MILSIHRPEDDFMEEKAKGIVTKEILHGVEFLVIIIQK